MGAFDYVEKNIPDVDVFELLMLKVDRALQQSSLQSPVDRAHKARWWRFASSTRPSKAG